MTLTNPFGIERYLHPRRSGMIVFKGGGDPPPAQPAPVVDGGLSDEQYQNLVDNQNEGIGLIGRPSGTPVPTPPPDGMFPNPVLFNNLGGKYNTDLTPRPGFGDYEDGALRPEYTVGPGFGIAQPRPSGATGLYGEFENLGDNVGAGFSGVNTGIAGVNTGVNTGFADLTTLLDQYKTDQTNQFGAVNTAMTDNAANINTGLGTLQTAQDAGFNNMGTRFDTVDTAGANLQTAVDTGFQDTAATLSNTNANINTGFADANTAMAGGFADTQAGITSAADAANTQLSGVSDNVLAGQRGLSTDLGTMSANQDIYAGSVLGNQENMQGTQDSFQSNFDDYVERYSDDASLAQNTRADMQRANANANLALRTDIGQQADTANVQAAETARRVQAVQINQAKELATQVANNGGVDAGTRQNFANLTTSFDSSGNLIPSSVDGTGNRVNRAIDQQGNLVLTAFNNLGQPIGNQSINIAQSLSVLEQLNRDNTASTGFAAPYLSTG